MPKFPIIQYLKNKEINKHLWDDCIAKSSNSLIYAKSEYLDNMCEGWSAIIEKNYDWVLPVTQRTKWGITYLYQPSLTQQLGIFAKPNIAVPIKSIITFLQKKVLFWEISWNYATATEHLNSSIETAEATNFILSLHNTYETIAAGYHTDLNRNLKLSKRFCHTYRETKDFKKCIKLYKEHYAQRLPMIKKADYEKFELLCSQLQKQNEVYCREAINIKQEVLATALLLFDGKRLYNIINTTTEAGRKTKANHFLLDQIIQEFSAQELLFDFEGSDVPGVKSFYENFGAINQPFYRIKYNNLPWPLSKIKK